MTKKVEEFTAGFYMVHLIYCLQWIFIWAEQLICITGWSVWTDLKLFRGENQTIDPRTLGQILVDKANRGVNVYVMVWDEATTGKNNVLESVVTMGTHDEDTFRYFENTGKQHQIIL